MPTDPQTEVNHRISGEPLIASLYSYAKKIYEGEITAAEALRSTTINHASARDIFRNFRQMREGNRYERTMNAEVTEYFLGRIRADYGKKGLATALEALQKHLEYYDTLSSGSQRKIRALMEKYASEIPEDADKHEIVGTYPGPSPSFRPDATPTPIDLAVANTKLSGALSDRDHAFISDVWSKYGMQPFERKNMDAGNIRRALERGYFEYVAGDPASSDCQFQLTEKTRLSFESKESVVEEEVGSQTSHSEGDAQTVLRTIFKRNPNARADCLKYHGYLCKVCGFSFENKYGSIGRYFIHVHHLIEISSIGEAYRIDPIKDLMPVCPNCHAMLHQKRPAFTIDELIALIEKQGSDS